MEEHWRDERYKFFHSFDMPVITGHNLDDVIEWFLFSSMHGQVKLSLQATKTLLDRLSLTPKRSLKTGVEEGSSILADPANADRKFMRSIIRHDIVPMLDW